MITFDLRLDESMFDPDMLIKRFNLQKMGRVQQAVDRCVIDYSVPYVPGSDLAQSPYEATVIGSGDVVYPRPYARYLYYGEVYGPNIPIHAKGSDDPVGYFSPPGQSKHPTGKQMEYSSGGTLAGSYWIERMKADRINDILAAAQEAMR
jgi:hypothetical protein